MRVTNPSFILNLFATVRSQRPLFVVDDGVRLPATLDILGVAFHDSHRSIRARFISDPACLVAGREYAYIFSGSGAATVFESVCLQQRGSEVILALPREVRQTGFRESPRMRLDETDGTDVQFAHPRLVGPALVARVSDVAGRGLSFAVDGSSHALFPGDRIENVRIRTPQGTVESSAVVRSVVLRSESSVATCGVQLTDFLDRRDSERWYNFVFGRMHPRLVDGTGERTEASWGVLESSRYVGLWTVPSLQAHVRSRFVASWRSPAASMGHQLVLQETVRPEIEARVPTGVAAGSLVYPKTWMLHHLGLSTEDRGQDRNRPLHQACELISGILYRLKSQTDLQHFVIYVERGKRWNDRLYLDFARRYYDSEKLAYTPLHIFRGFTDGATEAQHASSVAVRPAEEMSWPAISARLLRTAEPAEQRAMALEPAEVDLRKFSRDCAAVGFERARHAYVASEDGVALAALVAESGDEGTNIFGLMNTCYIVSLAGAPVSAAVKAALVETARRHYRSLHKRTFLVVEPDDRDAASLVELGLDNLSAAMRWLAHRDVIPAWAAYLQDLLKLESADPGVAARRAVCA